MTSHTAPEQQVAADLARKAALVAPVVLLAAGVLRGIDGAVSAALALAIVAVNFWVSATLIARAAPHGPTAVGAMAMGGFVVRMAAIVAAVLVARTQSWVDLAVLLVVLVASHVVLLFWETRSVSLSLAYPGLHPKQKEL